MSGFDNKWLMDYLKKIGKVDPKNSKIANVNDQKVDKKGPKMNKTEARYESYVLRPGVFQGEIVAYWFEGVKFRLARKTFYTPDFFVQYPDHFECVEIKGGFVREDSILKFKVAREMWPCYKWVMMQYKGGEWREIIK